MRSSGLRSIVDTGLFDDDGQRARLLVRLWRVLARGRPLDEAAIRSAVDASGAEPDDAARLLRMVAERDGQGRVVGVMGLSLNDHPHRFTIAGVTLSTWCAVDTLFLPAMLDAVATVASRSPVSGDPIRLEVAPDGIVARSPPRVALSLPVLRAGEIDTSSSAAIRGAFCCRIHFFCSEDEATRWIAGRGEMEVIPVELAWRHAMETWGKVFARSRGHPGALPRG